MTPPPLPPDEAERLESLRATGLLDTPPEERYDRITRLAQSAFGTPIALISLVDADRQWFKSKRGLDAAQTPRAESFCGHAILGGEPFIVSDATKDERFADNPLVTGAPDIRFYAGAPIASPDGRRIGTLCVIDRKPRELTDEQRRLLVDLARTVEREIAAASLARLARRAEDLRRGFDAFRAGRARPLARRAAVTAALLAAVFFAGLTGLAHRGLGDLLELQTLVRASVERVDELVNRRESSRGAERAALEAEIEAARARLSALRERRSIEGESLRRVIGILGLLCLALIPPALWAALRHLKERERVEDEAAFAEARLRAILDGATRTSVIATDSEGMIEIFNRGAERLLGWSAEEMVGLRTPVVIHDAEEVAARGEELSRELGRRVEGFEVFVETARRDGYEQREWTYLRKDGSRVPVDLIVTALKGEDGTLYGYLGVAQDVSARKAAEKLREEVSHHVNHELRTPVGILTLGLSMLAEELDGKIDPMAARQLALVRNGATALQRLVSDLLDATRAQSGKLKIETENFDLVALAREVVEGFQPLAVQRALALALEAPAALPVRADSVRTRQVMGNLVDNALKFTPKGGRVAVTLAVDGTFARVSVKDDGPGMTPEDAARVFDRLYQTANKARKGTTGLGLGLFIAKDIVERQGGTISLESAPGRGCRFSFTVPAAA